MKKRLLGFMIFISIMLAVTSCSSVTSALRTVSLSDREWTELDLSFEETEIDKIMVSNISFIDISGKNLKFVYSDAVRVVGKYSTDLETKYGFDVSVSGDTMMIGTPQFLNVKTSSFELTVYAPFESVDVKGAYCIDFDCTGTKTLDINISGAHKINMLGIELDSLCADIAGSCTLSLEGNVKTLDCSLSGTSKITGTSLISEEARIVLSGTGNVLLESGNAALLDVSLSGMGSITGVDFLADNVRLSLSGSASASVFAKTELDVTISGAGKVVYKGSPTLKQTINGAGSITPLDPSATDTITETRAEASAS